MGVWSFDLEPFDENDERAILESMMRAANINPDTLACKKCKRKLDITGKYALLIDGRIQIILCDECIDAQEKAAPTN